MAGMGKRMRPHTLSTPKPLVFVAGKPIVHHLCEDIIAALPDKVSNISFIIHPSFGIETEKKLIDIAHSLHANGVIYYQHEALGTAHAILAAKEALIGPVIIAFADTLFKTDFKLKNTLDGTIWVKEIDDPKLFGVVVSDENGIIMDFIEKPQKFVSNKAIIGIYHFKDGANLCNEIQYLIDNNLKEKGEFQLTNALENMKNKGLKFKTAAVSQWYDCGNKEATVNTNRQVLINKYPENYINSETKIINSTIIAPCYIEKSVVIESAVIGPYVTLGEDTIIKNAIVKNTIVMKNTIIENKIIENSLIGNHVNLLGTINTVSIGAYNECSDK